MSLTWKDAVGAVTSPTVHGAVNRGWRVMVPTHASAAAAPHLGGPPRGLGHAVDPAGACRPVRRRPVQHLLTSLAARCGR